MIRAKKIKLYPNKQQRETLNKWFGTCRYLYNDVLSRINYKSKQNFQKLRNTYVTEKSGKYEVHKYSDWMYETPKEVRALTLKQMAENINTHLKKTKKMHFKSKKDKTQTITIPKQAIKTNNNKELIIYGRTLGLIKAAEKIDTLSFDVKIKRTYNMQWSLIIPYNVVVKDLNNTKRFCAIDPGSKTFLTGVDNMGNTFKICENSRDKLKKRQYLIDKLKSLLEKLKGTPKRLNYMRTKHSLKLAELKLENQLIEIHNKSINWLVKNYDLIMIPKLKVKKRGQNKLNREMSLFGHCKFINKLIWKCDTLNKDVKIVTEHYTSKSCSQCGLLNMINKDRILNCVYCENQIDRDINGAINILQKSLVEHCEYPNK